MSNRRARELLTSEQRLEFMSIPDHLTDYELGSHFTLSPDDLEIIKRHRRASNKLGFTLQLCVLRFPGWTLSDVHHISDSVVDYIAKQLDVSPKELGIYAEREQTKHEHLDEIRREFGFRNFTVHDYHHVSQLLLRRAMENGDAEYLIQAAIEDFRKQKVILPGMTVIERLAWEVRQRAEEKIFKHLVTALTTEQMEKLDHTLFHMPESSKTYLAWLRDIPGTSSPDSFLKVIDSSFAPDLNL